MNEQAIEALASGIDNVLINGINLARQTRVSEQEIVDSLTEACKGYSERELLRFSVLIKVFTANLPNI